jgi:hypothetical protein
MQRVRYESEYVSLKGSNLSTWCTHHYNVLTRRFLCTLGSLCKACKMCISRLEVVILYKIITVIETSQCVCTFHCRWSQSLWAILNMSEGLQVAIMMEAWRQNICLQEHIEYMLLHLWLVVPKLTIFAYSILSICSYNHVLGLHASITIAISNSSFMSKEHPPPLVPSIRTYCNSL